MTAGVTMPMAFHVFVHSEWIGLRRERVEGAKVRNASNCNKVRKDYEDKIGHTRLWSFELPTFSFQFPSFMICLLNHLSLQLIQPKL